MTSGEARFFGGPVNGETLWVHDLGLPFFVSEPPDINSWGKEGYTNIRRGQYSPVSGSRNTEYEWDGYK